MIKAFCLICCVGIAFLGMPESQATIPTTIVHAAIPIAIAALAINVEPIFVSVAAAAQILATSRSEIYQRIARGELDAIKDGSRTKITFESIKRCASSRPKAIIKLYVPQKRY